MTHAGAKEAGLTVAVVTGAGGSLGRAIARRLAAGGHAGPDASFVTGQTIEVNGGWVMS
jgi:NAD(P)-dependent dehydrogenase (short-subunit alcohol dehydrogenase family)